jgi:phosphoglycerate dehydrogenase-like enzyme
VGYHDTVDTAALAKRKIPLAITPGGTTVGVAEHTVMLILAVLRRLPFADAELRKGRFHINALRPVSRELRGRTVGLLGAGRIGRAVAKRLQPFDVRLLHYDPTGLPGEVEEELALERREFEELLAEADIVSLHMPLTAATRHVIDAAALARMKPGAFLVNTSRGGLVDEAALVAALRDGRLAGRRSTSLTPSRRRRQSALRHAERGSDAPCGGRHPRRLLREDELHLPKPRAFLARRARPKPRRPHLRAGARGVSEIAIIGAGTMGHSLALVFALGGHAVRLTDSRSETLDGAPALMQAALETLVEAGEADPSWSAARLEKAVRRSKSLPRR